MKKIAICSLMMMFLLSCATVQTTGKTDWAETVVVSYENMGVAVSFVKANLAAMEQQAFWSAEMLPKVKLQFKAGKADFLQAGDYAKKWIRDPNGAPLTLVPTLSAQAFNLFGTILGGRFEYKRKVETVDGKFGRFVFDIPQKFSMDKKLSGPHGLLRLAITPEMIEFAMNVSLFAINAIANYLDAKPPDLTEEQKLKYIERIEKVQMALPDWA